jgi:RimJ/RimL family protein N-acetyltransferase
MISGNKIRLRGKRFSDTANDYAWQTDPELARLDAVQPLVTSFSKFLESYARELHYGPATRYPFAIETLSGKHIGNCVYYGVDEAKGEAELGIMIGNRAYWDKGYGTDAVATLVGYIFRETELKRIYLKTLVDNYRAQKCFERCGFSQYGKMARDGNNFLLMEIHRKQWRQKRQET